jgi:hypothetical protein
MLMFLDISDSGKLILVRLWQTTLESPSTGE